MAIEFRTMRPNELLEWTALCASVFDESAAYFLRHFENDPWADADGVFLALDGGKMVSSVRVFTREMYVCGAPVATGGIGEVCTLPEYQGRGLSSALLGHAVSYMEGRGMPLSLLFTGTNRHYAKQGWNTFVSMHRRIQAKDLPALPEGYTCRPAEPGDAAVLRGLYGLSAGAADCAHTRNHPGYWDRWVGAEWKNVFVLLHGGDIAAYMDVGMDRDKAAARMRDFGALPGHMHAPEMMGAVCPAEIRQVRMPRHFAKGLGVPEESFEAMLRLNSPFEAGMNAIHTVEQLRGVITDPVFFEVDGF